MELKKNPLLSLQKERPLFTLIGFIFSFGIAFICLSFTFFKPQDERIFIYEKSTDDATAIVFKVEKEKIEKPDPKPIKKIIFDSPIFQKIDDKTIIKDPGPPEPKPIGNGAVIDSFPVIENPIIITKIFNLDDLSTRPEYIGGQDKLTEFLRDNLVYPKAAKLYHEEGIVNINFVIEKNGSISQVRLSGPKIGYDLDEEALRVVNLLGKFKPGTFNKHPVRVLCRIPIEFSLED